MSEQTLRALLAEIEEPILGGDLISAGCVADIILSDAGNEITLAFPYPAASVFADIVATAQKKFAAQGVTATFQRRQNIHARTVQGGVERLTGVKNIIAVASAKGGVGKSTTAVNIALALAQEGATTGILDADIYGPSLPAMLQINRRPQPSDDGGIVPISSHGLQLMSIGLMVDDGQPMVWRGPIATRAMTQLLRDTRWQEVDYLVLDLPPGTGDIQLTIAQKVPVTGAIIVTTPQALAVADAERGLVMFNKVSIPVLGVVENMSGFHCPHCGNDTALFGADGGEQLCRRREVELLGKIPLAPALAAGGEDGAPLLAAAPDSPIARQYRRIAARAAALIAQKSRDRTAAFPKIVPQST